MESQNLQPLRLFLQLQTHVQNAEAQSILKRAAPLVPLQTNPMFKRPRYLRGMAWCLDESSFSPTAKSTLYATPLPPPGSRDFSDVALNSLTVRPDLFAIVTPVNINKFRELLQEHPNRPFIESVLDGLCEGF